jgi:ferrous iron transport protein B
MLVGFGCTVPAILATRILESRRDRLTTMLVLPLVSCGARFPIYALLIPAFFPPRWRAPMLWIIYLVGILAAVLLAKLLRASLFRGETEPFVMELPPYRMPTFRSAAVHTWDRGRLYLRKAGTIILAASIVMWALVSYPKPDAAAVAELEPEARASAAVEHSVAGRIGRAMEPVTRPIGFDWKINTAMIGAFAAKEIFVAQMGIVHALGETDETSVPLQEHLQRNYTPLQGLAIMLFALLGFPCLATVGVMWSESGGLRWAALQWAGLTALAYVVALVVYQAGLALGWGTG